jgi:peptidoglycan lytic transglycosylase G
MHKMSNWARILLLAGGIVLLGGLFLLGYVFYGPNDFEGAAEKTFYVSRGEPFSAIVDSLSSKGIIRDKALFVFVAKIRGGISRLQVGKYIFRSGVSNSEIFLTMRSGRGGVPVTITIPEGLTARAQAKLLNRVLGLDSAKYMRLVTDESFAEELGVQANTLEGYLFPESYVFTWQQDEHEVIRKLVDEFKHFYTDSLRERERELGWTTEEVLTMASIVEGESRLKDERPVIAGVYRNRLRKGMLLEADPTIQYALEGGPRRLLYSDLKMDSPYNTYTHKGLPPGPVNNPGRASILAALYPAEHNYYFFVANGTGGHWFSTTFNEHKRMVRMARHRRALSQAGSAASGSQAMRR